jgi:hypothetical protein
MCDTSVGKLSLGHIFFLVRQFSPVIIILLMLRVDPFITENYLWRFDLIPNRGLHYLSIMITLRRTTVGRTPLDE